VYLLERLIRRSPWPFSIREYRLVREILGLQPQPNVQDSDADPVQLSFCAAATLFFLKLNYGGFMVNQWNIRFRDLQKVIQVSHKPYPHIPG
jgi:hypothetical protein